jgi:hypothetical protein
MGRLADRLAGMSAGQQVLAAAAATVVFGSIAGLAIYLLHLTTPPTPGFAPPRGLPPVSADTRPGERPHGPPAPEASGDTGPAAGGAPADADAATPAPAPPAPAPPAAAPPEAAPPAAPPQAARPFPGESTPKPVDSRGTEPKRSPDGKTAADRAKRPAGGENRPAATATPAAPGQTAPPASPTPPVTTAPPALPPQAGTRPAQRLAAQQQSQCAGTEYLARLVCEERVRLRFCRDRWDEHPDCMVDNRPVNP